jgi:hypothetical protein
LELSLEGLDTMVMGVMSHSHPFRCVLVFHNVNHHDVVMILVGIRR